MIGKKTNIILIIIIILLVGIMFDLIKKDYSYNEKIILKALTEAQYDNNITSLNKSHEEYANYIEESKKKIASAITSMGVETSEGSTLEIMVDNIKNISTNKDTNIYLIKDGVVQSGLEIDFKVEGLTQKDGYLQPTSSTVASGRVSIPQLDLSKYKGALADVSSTEQGVTTTYWYIGGTNATTSSRQAFAAGGYTGVKEFTFACRNNLCKLYNLYLIPN